MKLCRVGLIGCDTSHCSRFAELLNRVNSLSGMEGVRIVAAYPGGSEKVDPGFVRRERFVAELRNWNVPLVDSIENVTSESDALMILSADAELHLEEFQRSASPGKPVFIDKPLALSSRDGAEILRIAQTKGVPLCTASALRFSRPLAALLQKAGRITGVDVHGPATWINEHQGFFFYGIHAAEMLYEAMGSGCEQITAMSNETHDVFAGKWKDGRLGTVRGFRNDNKIFSAAVHTSDRTLMLENAIPPEEPIYVPLLQKVIPFLRGEETPVEPLHSLEVIRFIEAAQESTRSGKAVFL